MRSRGVHSPTLWALTFHGIDDCGSHKRDAGIKPDKLALNLWRLPEFDIGAQRIKRAIPSREKQKGGPYYGAGFPVPRGEQPSKEWPFPPAFPVLRVENGHESRTAFPVPRAPINKYAKGGALRLLATGTG